MEILLDGIVAVILGVIGLIGRWGDSLRILKGVIPIIFVLGCALAIYLGIEDTKVKAVTPALRKRNSKFNHKDLSGN